MQVIIREFGRIVAVIAPPRAPLPAARSRALAGGLVLAILVGIAACAPSGVAAAFGQDVATTHMAAPVDLRSELLATLDIWPDRSV